MFDNGSITDNGRTLLTAATSSNRLYIVSALTDSNYKSDAQIQAQTSIDSGMGAITGTIYKTTYTPAGNLAKITARFQNVGSSVTMHGIWLKARLETQSSADEKLFAAVMSEDGFYMPSTSSINSYIDVEFDISFVGIGQNVHIVQDGACTQDDLDAAINNLKARSKDLDRVYNNFLEAQAYCKEGCGFAVDPNGEKLFKVIIDSFPLGTVDSWWISDVYDQYIVVMATNDQAMSTSNRYMWVYVYDITQNTIFQDELRLTTIHVCAKLGDESATDGNATILKVSDKYFLTCYTNNTSTNQYWYNEWAGQTSGYKVVGRCAIMSLNNYTSGTRSFTKGWWYGPPESGSSRGFRAIGGEYALNSINMADSTQNINLVQFGINPSNSGSPLMEYFNRSIGSQGYIDEHVIGDGYTRYSFNCIHYAAISKFGADFVMIGAFYDSSTNVSTAVGLARCKGNYQTISPRPNSYYQTVNSSFVTATGCTTAMLGEGYSSQLPIDQWNSSGGYVSGSDVLIQRDYSGFTLGSGAQSGSSIMSVYESNAITIRRSIDLLVINGKYVSSGYYDTQIEFTPMLPWPINNKNFVVDKSDTSTFSDPIVAYSSENGGFSYSWPSGTGFWDFAGLLYAGVVRGTQLFTHLCRYQGIQSGAKIPCIDFAPSRDFRGMKVMGKI